MLADTPSTAGRRVALAFTIIAGACAPEAQPRGGPVVRAEPTTGFGERSTGLPEVASSTGAAGSTSGADTGSGAESGVGSTGQGSARINCECRCKLAGQKYYVSGVNGGNCYGELFRYTVADAAACTNLNGSFCRGADGQNPWTYYGGKCRTGLLTAKHHSCTFLP